MSMRNRSNEIHYKLQLKKTLIMFGTPNSVLFYPHMELHDVNLVKESLLLYDNFFRIIPNDIIPNDHPEVKEFIEEYDLVKPIDPGRYTESTMEKFQNKLEEWNAAGLSYDESEKPSFLHEKKMYHKLRDSLVKEHKLLQDGCWLKGDAGFIANYMIFLSKEISRKNKLALLTNDSPAFTVQDYFNYNGNYGDNPWVELNEGRSNDRAIISMVIADYIPNNIEKISFSSIVEFRDEFKQERNNFLEKFSDFSKKLSDIQEPSVFNDQIGSFKQSLEYSLTDYKNSCAKLGPKHFFGAKIVTIPMFLPVANLFLSLSPEIIKELAVCGVFFGGLWALYSYNDDLETLRKGNPYSYLDLMQKYSFNPIEEINDELHAQINEFVCD